jgi:hypothetical protein
MDRQCYAILSVLRSSATVGSYPVIIIGAALVSAALDQPPQNAPPSAAPPWLCKRPLRAADFPGDARARDLAHMRPLIRGKRGRRQFDEGMVGKPGVPAENASDALPAFVDAEHARAWTEHPAFQAELLLRMGPSERGKASIALAPRGGKARSFTWDPEGGTYRCRDR